MNKELTQRIIFTSGMNSDTSEEMFPVGAARYRFNCRVLSTNDDNGGALTTANGNTLVPYSLPTGVNACIGYFEDPVRKKGYAHIYNSTGRHSILEYDEVLNSIAAVFIDDIAITGITTGSILNYKLTNLITGGKVIELDANNHKHYFTDNYINPADTSDYNEPHGINIEQGKAFVLGVHTGQYSSPFKKKFVDRIKEPPPPPTYVWSGLFSQIPQFIATLNNDTTVSSLTPVDVPFQNVTPVASPPYSTITHLWTVTVAGYYNIIASVGLQCATNVIATFQMENLTTSTVLDMQAITILAFQPIDPFYYIGLLGIQLAIGDQINLTVSMSNTTSPLYLVPTGGGTVHNPKANFWEAFYTGSSPVTNIINNLFKKLFRFQLEYGYKDKEDSVLSQFSDYIMPQTSSGGIGTGNDYFFQDNVITITVNTGSSSVQKIRIYGQQLNAQALDALSSTTSLIITIDKNALGLANDSTYNFTFLNDGNYTPINLQDATQLMDFVPVRSQAEEEAKNRLMDANVTEGMDAIVPDMRFPQDFSQQVDIYSTNLFFPKRQYLKSGSIYVFGQSFNYGKASVARLSTVSTMVGKSTDLNAGNGIFGTQVHIPFLTETGYTAPHGNPNLDMQYVPTVKCFIYNKPPSDGLTYIINRSKNQSIEKYIQFVSAYSHFEDINGADTTAAGAYYVSIIINNITGVFKDKNPTSLLVYDFTVGDRIRFIANRVPGGGGSHSSDFIYSFFPFNDNEIADYNPATGEVFMNMTPTVPIDLAENFLFEIYTPAKTISNDNELMFEVGEGGTFGTDANGNKIYVPNNNGLTTVNQLFENFGSATLASANTYHVTKLQSGTFAVNDNVKLNFTAGSIYGVVSNVTGSVITVNTTGFTIFGTLSLTGVIVRCSEQTFTSGDCFRRKSNMYFSLFPAYSNVNPYDLSQYIESMNASDMFQSEAWDYGRPNRTDNNAKRLTTGARVIFSQLLLPDSNVNGLSKIYDGSFQDYNRQYGAIWLLFFKNNFLEAYQELKVLPIIVEQQIIQSPDGTDVALSTAEKVLSKQQGTEYYKGEFGIGQHPESKSNYGSRDYWLDVRRSAILRKSDDGIIDISTEANMSIFLANLCTAILANPTKVNCVGVYDTRFGEYILSIAPFGSGDYALGITIAFNEKYNAFGTFWGYIPDYMGQNGVDIISFKNGGLWTHNTNAIQNNFYGVQQYSEMWPIMNADPKQNKILLSVMQETNNNWVCTSLINKLGQETRMVYDSNWVKYEGNKIYAFVKRDLNTPVVTNPIISGYPMRDTTFLAKLRYTKTDFNRIAAINFIYQNSYM